MPEVVIKEPILNSPFEEPKRHFKFTEDGITDEIIETRRKSEYFIPIPQPKKKGPKQLAFDTTWTADRIQENDLINQIRQRVALWRRGRYTQLVTKTTARLLEYWQKPDREHRLFFCQIEAIETVIYLTEVANKSGDDWIENRLKAGNETSNPELYRVAFKMATGSGKTVVMAMLIAWHTLNKLANPQDPRFSDTFLVVTPGITIKDRLRVLMPSDPQNYYRLHDLVPPDQMPDLNRANLVITNYHAFILREKLPSGKLTKDILATSKGESPFAETPDQMVRRVCRSFGSKRNVVILNDEAHHCYRLKPGGEAEKLTGDERKEAEKRAEEARIWITGLEAVKRKVGVRAIYDLSATPFFLRGSGYNEGVLFPWVISDFSLIDAIESGIVKVPRVPIADDSMTGELPTYRDLWLRIRDDLPKKGRAREQQASEPKIPFELEGALHSLYSNYRKYFNEWEQNAEAQARGLTPPVFIVVCNNTNVSKMVFDYVSGWEKTLPDGSARLVPGKLPLFSNVDHERWVPRPNTILIDSEQLESGEGMSDEYKKIAAVEIAEFKAEYQARFPGRDVANLTDEDLLREVMNTVGKAGKLGEHVKCVVSVSMLTEGWDASTVTHILGVRTFGTQLLCEQVVGRALRRMSHATTDHQIEVNGSLVSFESYSAEFAEVYGVPFSFIPTNGSAAPVVKPRTVTHVRAMDDRAACEITFPRVTGYRYQIPSEKLTAAFDASSSLVLSTADLPSRVEMASILGEKDVHTLEDLRKRRDQEIDFRLASLVLEKYFKDAEGGVKPWLFPQLLEISRAWRRNWLVMKDNVFPQLLLLVEPAHRAADRIYRAIVASQSENRTLLPILRPYEPEGSTRYVAFDTAKPVYTTDPAKCHVSHVVADTQSWEEKMAQALEEMDEVHCYVKNEHLNFTIPYTVAGEERSYFPDFLVKIEDGRGPGDLLNLIVEVSGDPRPDKAEKVATARNLWVPAMNNLGKYGRWAFLEVTDPWNAKNMINGFLTRSS